MRMSQLRKSLQSSYMHTPLATNPVFQQMAPGIVDSLQASGVTFSSPETEYQEARGHVTQRTFGRKQGYRVTFNRFLVACSEMVTETKSWHVDRFERSYLALEADMVGNAALLCRLRLSIGAAEAAEEGEATTSANRVTLAERGDFRSSLQIADLGKYI